MAMEPSARRAAFRRLHQAACFAGFAFSNGLPNGGVPGAAVLRGGCAPR
jgi:hypothetical protein